MKKLFIETWEFTTIVSKFLTEEDYIELQKLLLETPDCGKVMPGCGGMRKVRMSDPRRRKGKRGGLRVVYLHVPSANLVLLVDIYDKDNQENLTPAMRTNA
jgi:hypothetical protein